jgi:hypothetical protein
MAAERRKKLAQVAKKRYLVFAQPPMEGDCQPHAVLAGKLQERGSHDLFRELS